MDRWVVVRDTEKTAGDNHKPLTLLNQGWPLTAGRPCPIRKKEKLGLRQIKDRMVANLLTRYPSLFKRWVHKSKFIEFADTPWTQFDANVSGCRLALITTGGVHLKGQPPFNMNDPAGDPSFREIPADTPSSSLSITHNYYDHTDAEKDLNILLPMDRVRDLKKTGEIGSVNGRHFSFMGHITHHHIATLMNVTAPRVVEMLKRDAVDIVILAPA